MYAETTRQIINRVPFTGGEITALGGEGALGSRFGGEGEIPCVTWDLSGRRGGLQGDGGLGLGGGGTRFLRVAGLRRSGRVGAEVGQRKGDGSDVVDSEQNLQGVDLLEALMRQGLAGPLNLFDTRGEGTQPTSWGGEGGRTSELTSTPQSFKQDIDQYPTDSICGDVHGPQRLNNSWEVLLEHPNRPSRSLEE